MTFTSVILKQDGSFEVPHALLEKLGWKPGQKLAVIPEEHLVLVADASEKDAVQVRLQLKKQP